jgi:glycosyltransferase involved in cell wall biosynthesis
VCLLVESLARSSYLETAAAVLVSRGWAVTVAGLSGPDELQAVLPGCRVVDLGGHRAHLFPHASLRLRRLLGSAGKRGIVHAFDDIPTAVAAPAVATVRGWRLLNHRHHIDSPLAWYWPWIARVSGAPLMACSPAVARAALAEGRPPRRVLEATNGAARPRPVTLAERERARTAVGAGPDDLVVTLIARLRPEKGHAFLLDAVEALPQALLARVVVAFVGDGPARDDISRRADRSTARVRLLGRAQDVAPHLSAADLVVMPSEYESFGLVAAEAMAAGRPLLSTPTDGVREMVTDNASALLVERDPVAWTAALALLLEDPDLRERLAAAGTRVYEDRFTIEHMVTRWEQVYATVLAERPGRLRA